MRILLIGKNGQVGRELQRLLPGSVATDRSQIDLENFDTIRSTIAEVKPNLIINAAAYTAVDRAEEEEERAFRINGEAPGVIAEEAKRIGAKLVHYSTDYVFDGKGSQPYTEKDEPSPLGVYGKSKLAGEEAIQQVLSDYLILRTSWVYSPYGRNFFLTMQRLAKEGKPIRVVDDQYGVPTPASMLAEYTLKALEGTGLYHLVPSGETTWFGFAREIVQGEVEPITTAEFPTPAERPTYSVLSNKKFCRDFNLEIPDWKIYA